MRVLKMFNAIREISLVKTSPNRTTKSEEIRNQSKNDDTIIYAFCPTHWSVSGETLECKLKNHAELVELW